MKIDLAVVGALFRKPSAYVPLAMSLCALLVVATAVSLVGVDRAQDEGATAHLFQLLMIGQVPIIFFFGLKSLPKNTKASLVILSFQVVAFVIAFSPVWILGL